jgi:hypothetical protein
MRCHICNTGLSEVHFNADHQDFEPCPTCLEVIQDTLEGFLDKPSADEDELGFEPLSAYVPVPSTYDPYEGYVD